MRLLVVEDEMSLARVLRQKLRRHYVVDVACFAHEAQKRLRDIEYDLLILDIQLPDMDGVRFCQKIREEEIKLPILMLTANSQLETKVSALDSGADDYLTKPFEFEELFARLRSLLRRGASEICRESLRIADLILQTNSRVVKRAQQLINLRPKEFQLLEYLMRNCGQVLSRDLILEHVWDKGVDSQSNTVDAHISFLRKKIDQPFRKKLIKSLYGLGYKIEE